ncbi:MAG: zf-HC2 domain-containing protein [Armatimonadetes bacterium]|nr:zf-HC2 domain-containing protein [Armatimonadota bacterium]
MPKCPAPETIQAYVDGELPGSEAVQMAEHISRCARCEAVHRWLALISSNLSAQPRPQPGPELIEAIHGAVDLAEPVAQISCSDAQSLISAHVDGELTAQEQLPMWRHLFDCEACYQQLIQTQQITKALRRAQPVALPAGLEAGVHNAVEAEIARRQVGVISLLRWRISKRSVGATVAAAAALLIGLLLIPQQPVTRGPQVARAPAEVTAPIEVPATLAQPADVEQRAEILKTDQAFARETAVRVATRSLPAPAPRERTVTAVSSALASAGGGAPQPVSPTAPPTNTDEGPILARYQPGATPALPAAGEKPLRIEYTPIATVGESIYANLEPVAESRLDAAREGVNERVAMNVSYSKRPELEIVH